LSLQIKRESEQRLIEKLDRQRVLNHELNTAKQQLAMEANNQELQTINQELEQYLSEKVERETIRHQELTAAIADTESQIILCTQQVTEKEAVNAALEADITDLKRQAADKDASAKVEVAAVQIEVEEMKGQFAEKDAELRAAMDRISAMQAEVDDFRGQLQIKNAQVEDLSQLASTRGEEKEQFALAVEQLQGRLLEVQQVMANLIKQNEAKQKQIDQLMGELTVQGEENSDLVKEVDQLKQKLACTKVNVAELVGAGPNAVIIDDPPTQPPTQDCIVDRAAYDALHQAYESLESNFHSTKDANKELAMKLQSAQIKIDEMVACLEQEKDKYEILAKENHELKEHGRTPVPPILSNKPADRQLKEMESINKELVASCEVATQQLSARKEEMKQQLVRIEQLETELAQVNLEFEQFQDKHDKIVHGKTESLDVQQVILNEKLKELVECQQALQASEREKAKLEGIDRQVQAQLNDLKVNVPGCPDFLTLTLNFKLALPPSPNSGHASAAYGNPGPGHLSNTVM
jgi:chromosome segregation ATPase